MEYLSTQGMSHLTRHCTSDTHTDMYEFCFELPSSFSTLHIPPGSAVAVRAHINGVDIIRHYSPLSRSDAAGYVTLYLKAQPDKGVMSRCV